VRFLADMGLAQSTVAFLHEHGHDAVHLCGQELQRLDDNLIVRNCLDFSGGTRNTRIARMNTDK
jgi:hypothetical protein